MDRLITPQTSDVAAAAHAARNPVLREDALESLARVQPIGTRDNDSHGTDRGRAAHLLQHLGAVTASALTLADIEAYREARLSETTKRGSVPSPATLDREIELLKRIPNKAVAYKKLSANPISDVNSCGSRTCAGPSSTRTASRTSSARRNVILSRSSSCSTTRG